MHLQRDRKGDTEKTEQAARARTECIHDQFPIDSFKHKNLCRFREGNVNTPENRHILPGQSIAIGGQQRHVVRGICQQFENFFRIQRAGVDLELRTVA
jgi:hypothetical protein